MSAQTTLGTIAAAFEKAAESGLEVAVETLGGETLPSAEVAPAAPVAAPVAPATTPIAPEDVAKFATAFLAWLGKQEPTILADLSIADTLTKFVAVFVPGAEAVDLGIEMAETDIPVVYNVGSAALPFVVDLAGAGAMFAPAPPGVLGAPRATGIV